MKRAVLFGGLPVLAGIALIAVWWTANAEASRGKKWTQVVATIETASLQQDTFHLGYRYEAAGREYRNPNGRLSARGISAGRFAKGGKVVAYFNPAAPAESLLQSAPAPSPVPLIAGIVLLVVGIPLAVYCAAYERGPQPVERRKGARKTMSGKNSKASMNATGTGSGRRPSPPMSRLKPPPPTPPKK